MTTDSTQHVASRIKSFSLRGGRMVRQYEDLLAARGPEFIIDLAPGDAPTTIAPESVVDLSARFGREAPLVGSRKASPDGPGSLTITWLRQSGAI